MIAASIRRIGQKKAAGRQTRRFFL